ncbi:hypothetical protein PMAYCL1PPCAC_11008, partial [Pristionchus mayeri]
YLSTHNTNHIRQHTLSYSLLASSFSIPSQMAEGWFKFTGASPYPPLTANSDHSKFTYGILQNRQFRMGWIQGKHDKENENMVLDWIARTVGISLDGDNAAEKLIDGMILCQFMHCLNSHALARKISYKSSRFGATENLENFQDALIALGLNRSQLFPISDLIEKKELSSLVNTLVTLKKIV